MRFYLKVLLILLMTVSCLLTVYVILTNSFRIDGYSRRFIEQQKNDFIFKINELNVDKEGNLQYYIWCVFTKIKRNERSLENKFKNMLESLLKHSTVKINLNVIVDTSSRSVGKEVVRFVQEVTGKKLVVEYYDVHVISNKLQDLLDVMRPHFSSQPGAYYSDSLFFVSMGLFKTAPINQHKVIMIDVDTIIKEDIAQLFKVFDDFNSSNVFGASPELTPVYHHVLYMYRYKHKGTLLGEPYSTGGFPGVNSGVLLLHLENMRKSKLFQTVLTKQVIDRLAEKYSFKGHLGDQDFYTLISLEHPELMYLLDCGWNRQLCTWWREHGYRETFNKFSECNSTIKLYHGNCNSVIPSR